MSFFWQRCLCVPQPAAAEEEDLPDLQIAFLRGDFRPKPASLPPPPPSALVGKQVVLMGLVNRPELNGRTGTVMSYDAATGRYAVLAVGTDQENFADRIKEYLKVKAVNLEVVGMPPSEPLWGPQGPTAPAVDSGSVAPEPTGAAPNTAPVMSSSLPPVVVPPAPNPLEAPANPLAGQEAAMLAQHRAAQANPGALYAEREATLTAMPREQAQVELRNESLLRDAKMEGNQGNLVVRDGKMVLLDEDDMGGSCERYKWGQSERELVIKVPVAKEVRSKDVRLTVTSIRMALEVAGEAVINGELNARVIADESIWKLEDDESAGGSGGRLVTVRPLNEEWHRSPWLASYPVDVQ